LLKLVIMMMMMMMMRWMKTIGDAEHRHFLRDEVIIAS